MPEDATGVDWTCDLCGRSVQATSDGPEGMTVEVAGRGPDGEWSFWDAGFCSQEHAAELLRRPLPSPANPSSSRRTTWQDRAGEAGCIGAFLAGAAVLLVGAWTVADWVVGLF